MRLRWLVVLGATVAFALSIGTLAHPRRGPPGATGPLEVRAAELRQDGPRLVLAIRTVGSWSAAQLRVADGSLCAQVEAPRAVSVCVRARRRGLEVVTTRAGTRKEVTGSSVARPDSRGVHVRFPVAGSGVPFGLIRWRATSSWSGAPCAPPCTDSLPSGQAFSLHVRKLRLAGCVPKGPSFREHGPRRGRRIALTLDGGPTDGYTERALRILKRNQVRVTFFIRGQFVKGRERLLRRELAAGDELANHSFTHPHKPSYGELARTSRLIRGVTGFSPCLFRPPYGDVDERLIGDARRLGMLTIQWDVDSLDSLGAGTGTVYSRVTGLTRPGSIVLMHDGEGSHEPTIRALPRILANLKRRGYRFVTVSELLGLKRAWRPSRSLRVTNPRRGR